MQFKKKISGVLQILKNAIEKKISGVLQIMYLELTFSGGKAEYIPQTLYLVRATTIYIRQGNFTKAEE